MTPTQLQAIKADIAAKSDLNVFPANFRWIHAPA